MRLILPFLLAGCSLGLDLSPPAGDPGDGAAGDAPVLPDAWRLDAASTRQRDAAPRDAGARDASRRSDAATPRPDASPPDAPPPDATPPDAASARCDDPRFQGPRCDLCVAPGVEGPECDRCVDRHRAPPDCAACAAGFGGPDCEPVADTEVLLRDSPWAPTARLVHLDIPGDAEAARDAGCRVWGSGGGSHLATLIALSGDLSERVTRDADDQIDLVLLAHLDGWGAEIGANAASPVDLAFYLGIQEPVRLQEEAFWLSRRSFVDGEPNRGPANRFPRAEIAGGRLAAGPSTFRLELEVDRAVPLTLRFDATRIYAGLDYTRADGLSLDGGRIEGYLSRDALIAVVTQIQTACDAADPPDACATVSAFLRFDRPPDEGADTLATLFGGYDAHLEEDRPGRCEPRRAGDCNSIGVCMLFEAAAAEVLGVDP